MRVRTLAVVTAAALAVAGLVAPAAVAAPSGLSDDFNGDGYRDLAIGTPKASGGTVTVLFGSASGVSPARSVNITQNSPGVPGTSESEDKFGDNVTAGDVDGDGYADLIIGAPYERITGSATGAVTIVWGGEKPFTRGGTMLTAPSADAHMFGEGTSFADLDGDGKGNLVVIGGNSFWWYEEGNPAQDGAHAPKVKFLPEDVRLYGVVGGHFSGTDGSDYVLHGQRTGSSTTPYVGLLRGGSADIGSSYSVLAEGVDPGAVAWEPAVAAGDINGDGFDDLVTGNSRAGQGGSFTVRYGRAAGLPAKGTTYTQDSAGVPGTDEAYDYFGAAVAVGDATGDGYADIAVGATYEEVDGRRSVGNVVFLKGSAAGLTTSGARSVHQATSGVPGAAEAGDHFGSALRLRDIDGNGRADLAIGAFGEDVVPNGYDDGAAWVLRGASSGLTTTDATAFNATDFGYPVVEGRKFADVFGR
ncbi:FG-GAP-like repeat-containing protein [Streptomyces albidochromogenes]|uniref:FG-GAP-like repeat-containing protein n=1 Tax=Streptomyces albidochromogenes TaxID=329524 RepID=A0ABW6FKX5_9ACTN